MRTIARHAWRQTRSWFLVATALVSVGGARVAAAQRRGGSVRSTADTGTTGTIAGVVHDAAGEPVPGVHVDAGGKFSASTDSAGRFVLRGLPVGTVALTLRRLGFSPSTSIWALGEVTLNLELRIDAFPAALPPVLAEARREPYDSRLAGFNARRKKHIGFSFTAAQIDSMNESRLTDVLTRIPGVRPYTMRGALGTSVTLAGSRCPPLVMVDGFPAALGSFDLNMIAPSTVEGIEVYQHGSTVPAELSGPYGTENCGLIAIWSRPMRPRVRADQLPTERPLNLDSLLRANAIYPPDRVEQPVAYIEGTAVPIYPDSLFRARVPGRVTTRFVVDTTGRIEAGTIEIESSTAAAFGDAVRRALRGASFRPAMAGGHRVRQLVEMPFDFRVSPGDSTVNKEQISSFRTAR